MQLQYKKINKKKDKFLCIIIMLIIVTLMYMNLKFLKINSKNIITLKIKLKIILLFY